MRRPTLLFLRKFAPRDRQYLIERLKGLYEIIEPAAYDEPTLAGLAQNAEVALGPAISAVILQAAPRLRFLQTPGAGLEQLDLQALASRDVVVCRSASHARQVAEHAVALLLSLMRKIALHDRLLRNGVWYRPQGNTEDTLYQTDSIQGATIGLLGFGAINQRVARLLSSFEVQLRVCARHPHPGMIMASLTELMQGCDAIVVAVPLTDATKGMIGAQEFAAANSALYLVNVGRAEVIDRQGLHAALANRNIRGAALDVPYGGVDVSAGLADFVAFDSALLSPHRAGTVRGYSLHLNDVIDNLVAYVRGEALKNVVNCEAGY